MHPHPHFSLQLTGFSSYFASKECTYTDASGRPVPAPRSSHPDRLAGSMGADMSPSSLAANNERALSLPVNKASVNLHSPTAIPVGSARRPGPDDLVSLPSASSLGSSPSNDSGHSSPTSLLDPSTTHELVNCERHALLPAVNNILTST
jgi:hypothetical protein